MIRWRSQFFMPVFLLLLLLLSCVPVSEPILTPEVVPKPPDIISGDPAAKYDLYFRRWGEFYFPFEDWKWFKSQSVAESSLDPNAMSWCGAQGLMQLMPGTAKDLGVQKVWDPEENIMGGVKYDQQVDKIFKEIDWPERRRFMFAGYNAGPGNIKKARGLAMSDVWEDVACSLPKVTGKHSSETIGYVKRIYKVKTQL